jgi:hypothetical protein
MEDAGGMGAIGRRPSPQKFTGARARLLVSKSLIMWRTDQCSAGPHLAFYDSASTPPLAQFRPRHKSCRSYGKLR